MTYSIGTLFEIYSTRKMVNETKETGNPSNIVAASKAENIAEAGSRESSEVEQLLWEQECQIRQKVARSPVSGNFVGAFFVNTYSAIYIFVVYLISLESLLSIGLSVGMTVCKYREVYLEHRLLDIVFSMLLVHYVSCLDFRHL